MQLSLRENIKKYRKEMGLTQEELAEAFSVTVGAVSKWESGSTVPDILTLMELADFFSISMDVLLGYNMSSKNIDAIADRMETFLHDSKWEDAAAEAEKAMVRYPGSFKCLYKCAEVYTVLSTVLRSEMYGQKAIEIYMKALRYISQNDDPEISEFSIRLTMAEIKSKKNPEEALEELRQINYMGIADLSIALNLRKLNRIDEALGTYTKILVSLLVKSGEYAMSMMLVLTSMDTTAAYKEAAELMDWCIALFDNSSNGKISYLSKMKVTILVLKALSLSCLKEYEKMQNCMDEAYDLAKRYDREPANELAGKIKFWHAGESFHPAMYDAMGVRAVEGIDKILYQDHALLPEKVVRKMGAVREYWEKVKSEEDRH